MLAKKLSDKNAEELATSPDQLAKHYAKVRETTLSLCKNLEPDDFSAQSMTEASPVKWHLAHTSWFFETFVLKVYVKNYKVFHPQFEYLFNSYYNAVGEQYPRPDRGLMTRPTLTEVFNYRRYIDQQVLAFLCKHTEKESLARILLGLHHEQQHQELLLTDLKHLLSKSPLFPAVFDNKVSKPSSELKLSFTQFDGGLSSQGFAGESAFFFDNELPEHQNFLSPFEFANRLCTNQEFIDFIEDGAYTRPELWLADAWALIQQQQLSKPLYWIKQDNVWFEYQLSGLQQLEPLAPVCHISFYEADAFARWKNKRLPTEQEWEHVARTCDLDGNFLENAYFRPLACHKTAKILQLFGDVWEWTSSSYSPYPGFKANPGALGEYNGKFMCNQIVLRGGSCVTSESHIRASYRNFFYPQAQWQFSGIRLANSL